MSQPNFPNSPQPGDTYTYSGSVWTWTGAYWRVLQGVAATGGSIVPAANVAYDLGSDSLRWRDLYLSGNSLIIGGATLTATGSALTLPAGSTLGGQNLATSGDVSTGGGPKITNLQITSNVYVVLDDTAVDITGGFIRLTGTNFVTGCMVYVASTPANSTTFVSTTEVRAQLPAIAAGTYPVYLVNPDGGTAIRVPGVTFSASPAWQTASNLGEQYDGVVLTLPVVATDATVYTLTSGSLPPGLSLNSNTGVISGTVSGVANDTVYSFTITATDAELQDSPRTFTVTITVSDPYFKLTTLLLSGSAMSANTVIKDSSTNNFNLTVAGDARASNFTPYGTGWSVYFDGTGDYLSFTNSNNQITFGTDNFTIEFWVNFTNPTAVTGELALRNYIADPFTTDYFYLGKHASATVPGAMSFWLANYAGNLVLSDPTLPTVGWIHYAVVRNSNTWTLYRNGLAVHTVTSSVSMGSRNSNECRIGESLNGHISNLRVVKGTAVYTANFTPATTNLTSVANTSLLTCHVNSFRDASTNNFTITRNGDAAIRSFNPFNITNTGVNGSMYFDGTGDVIKAPANNSFAVGTGAFCVEFWSYVISLQNYRAFFTTRPDNGGYADAYHLGYDANGGTGLYSNADLVGAPAGTIRVKEWQHIVLCRNSSNITSIFVNGLRVGVGTVTSNFTRNLLGIGDFPTTQAEPHFGYMADFRLVKGSTPYDPTQFNITVPAAPLTAIANTQLLTLQYDQPHNNHTFLDASSNQFVVTRSGNTTQGTFSPFSPNGWSNYFDGTGDYLSLASNLNVGSSDFTIEAWAYPTAWTVEYTSIISTRASNATGGATDVWVLGVHNSGYPYVYSGAFQIQGNPGQVSLNAWHHIAVSRQGSTMRIFVNGVLRNTSTTNQNYTQAAGSIGANRDGSEIWTGYISNLRLVTGTALYTANFTPSTSSLTSITGTQLLTCHANRFIDSSSNSIVITRNGDTRVVAFSPFAPTAVYNPVAYGGSAYFDGTGDYLTVGSASDWTFMHNGLVSWTLSGVIYRNSATDMQLFSTNTNSVAGYQGMNVFIGSAGVIGASYTAGTNGYRLECTSNTSGLFPVGAWTTFSLSFNHLAAQGSRYSAVVNGTSYTSFTEQTIVNNANNAATFVFSTAAPSFTAHIGSFIGSISGTGNFISGYLTNYKIVTGATTVIELKFTDAAILDSTGRNVVESLGDIKSSSVITKFTGASFVSDGSGDYLLTAPTVDLEFGSGDFTIELWWYPTSTTRQGIYHGSFGADWCVGIDYSSVSTNQKVGIWASSNGSSWNLINADGGGNGIGTTSLTQNAWNHIAYVRNGTTWMLFVNGNRDLNLTGISGSIVNRATYRKAIGAWYSSGAMTQATGYLADLRITRYARYTANFTAPTAPARLK